MFVINKIEDLYKLGLRSKSSYKMIRYRDSEEIAVLRDDEYKFLKAMVEYNNPKYAVKRCGIGRGMIAGLRKDGRFNKLIEEQMEIRLSGEQLTREYLLDYGKMILDGKRDIEKANIVKMLFGLLDKKEKTEVVEDKKSKKAGKAKLSDELRNGSVDVKMSFEGEAEDTSNEEAQ